jgi:hypothetical protein
MWKFLSMGVLVSAAMGGPAHAKIIIDDFNGPDASVSTSEPLSTARIVQEGIDDVLGGVRYVALGSIVGGPGGVTSLVIENGTFKVHSDFGAEGFGIYYGSRSVPSGDFSIQVTRNEILELRFDSFGPDTLEFIMGVEDTDQNEVAAATVVIAPSDSPFVVQVPFADFVTEPDADLDQILSSIDGIQVGTWPSPPLLDLEIVSLRIVPEPSSWLTILISMSAYSIFLHRYVAKQRP